MRDAGIAAGGPKRVEVIVPSGAGGGNDRLVRIIQKTAQVRKLTDAVITSVSKPGAGQVVGIAYLNQQPADGHHRHHVSELRHQLFRIGAR